MPPRPNRAISVSITDFPPAEQRLLRAAFYAFVPLVLVGGLEQAAARMIALGHPCGLAAPADYPPRARIYGMVRIKGVDKQPEEVRLPVPVKRG